MTSSTRNLHPARRDPCLGRHPPSHPGHPGRSDLGVRLRRTRRKYRGAHRIQCYLAPLDAAVLRLYRAFFRREADVAGAIYWIDQHRNGASLEDLAWGFSNSDEFIADYGTGLGNAAFLDIVYPNALAASPTPTATPTGWAR
ncbi:MAG: DUF4214 domain-containing protein [Acidimicrobiales bacterium]